MRVRRGRIINKGREKFQRRKNSRKEEESVMDQKDDERIYRSTVSQMLVHINYCRHQHQQHATSFDNCHVRSQFRERSAATSIRRTDGWIKTVGKQQTTLDINRQEQQH